MTNVMFFFKLHNIRVPVDDITKLVRKNNRQHIELLIRCNEYVSCNVTARYMMKTRAQYFLIKGPSATG